MNRQKISLIKDFFLKNVKNVSFLEFLFAIECEHFRETGRRITNINYIIKNKDLFAEIPVLENCSFSEEVFTNRELKLMNRYSRNDFQLKIIQELKEGEINFLDLLDEYSVSIDFAQAVKLDDLETEEFRRIMSND